MARPLEAGSSGHAAAERGDGTPRDLSGALVAFTPITRMPQLLLRLTREHGPLLRFRLGPLGNVYFLGTPAAVEETLVTKAPAFRKSRGTKRLSRTLGDGLIVADQPKHRANRRLVQPAFHRKRLDDYGAVMAARSRDRVRSWTAGGTIDVEREMNQLALEIVSETLFGVDLHDEMDSIARGLDESMAAFPALMIPFSEFADGVGALPHNRKLRAGRAKLDAVVASVIAHHRADGTDRGDVMSMLLAARDDETGDGFSDEQIRDEAMTIMLAGHETTANALTWAFYLLQRHPEIESALHAHLDAVLGDRDPEFADVAKLDYVRAVFSETMRLYPPAWSVGRKAIADVEIAGIRMKRGDQAVISQYVMHRDPQWWPEPERFDPMRFMGEHDRPKFAYFPFGGGTRLCIGEAFAWTEGVLALATIARRVRLAPVDAADVPTLALVTLRPGAPVRARVEPRAARVEGAGARVSGIETGS